MKKTYIAPMSRVVIIKAPTILTVSDPNVSISKSGNVDAGDVESRGFDYFEDFDD